MICAVCGRKVKSDEIKKRWDGVFVCKEDWEPRHPLDFIRAINDDSSVPYISDEPVDQFVGPVCYISGISSLAGYAVAGCAITKNPYSG